MRCFAFIDTEKSVAALKPLHTIKSNLDDTKRRAVKTLMTKYKHGRARRKGVKGSGLTVVDVKGASV